MRLFISTLLLLLVVPALPAVAQEREIRDANLPLELESELLQMYGGGARRVDGPHTIPEGEVTAGDLAVVHGPLVVAGRVEGDVAMVGGDVVIETGGSVAGRITVIDGEVRMADGAMVGGTITAYGERRAGERYGAREREREDDEDRGWWDRRRREPNGGIADLTVDFGSGYNRVEGLPLMLGPVVQTGGRNPLRVEAMVVWRSEEVGEDGDRTGYQARVEQFLGGRAWSLGGTAYSLVDPMDRWQIRDLEASLSTVLFHDDLRDHFERTGWSAFVEARPARWLESRLEFRREEYASVPVGDPWSLFDGDDDWRAQPLVAEGDLRLLGGSVEVDLRDDRRDPFRGWLARARLQRALAGDLVRPAMDVATAPPGGDPAPTPVPAASYDPDFTIAMADVRRYMPVGWSSQLNVRVVAGGTLTERPLPPQFQHALGGIGTLPGYELFAGDCGARGLLSADAGSPYHPGYGCDRFALGQIEYRGDLSLRFGRGDDHHDDDDWWDDLDFDFDPRWVAFFDVARGWGYGDQTGVGSARSSTGTLYDVGAGFLLGDAGLYVALPLSPHVEQEPRFFIRLGRRF